MKLSETQGGGFKLDPRHADSMCVWARVSRKKRCFLFGVYRLRSTLATLHCHQLNTDFGALKKLAKSKLARMSGCQGHVVSCAKLLLDLNISSSREITYKFSVIIVNLNTKKLAI